jgi:hypothetical protein
MLTHAAYFAVFKASISLLQNPSGNRSLIHSNGGGLDGMSGTSFESSKAKVLEATEAPAFSNDSGPVEPCKEITSFAIVERW